MCIGMIVCSDGGGGEGVIANVSLVEIGLISLSVMGNCLMHAVPLRRCVLVLFEILAVVMSVRTGTSIAVSSADSQFFEVSGAVGETTVGW